ncbi:MAG: DUF1569 domain-containing protein [Roseateles sp.]
MDRRRALQTTTVLLAAAPLAGCSGRLKTFSNWREAQQAVLELLFREPVVQGSPWNLSQVLQHLAQSIEYSMQGYPLLKGAWFRSTLGSLAFGAFNAQGQMRHDLAEPIPGAPALDAAQALKTSAQRLLDAMDAFAQFSGTLRPHFAYGELTKPQYERAHLMHLANHWTQFHAKRAVA